MCLTSRASDVRAVNTLAHESIFCRDLTESAQELRLLLCRKTNKDGKERVTVVTACGIFVNDILEAAPIDKYFEMFKPGSGDEGGYVRLKMQMISEEELKAKQSGARDLSPRLNLSAGPVSCIYTCSQVMGASIMLLA